MQVSKRAGTVLDIDDFKQGNSHGPNSMRVFESGAHRVDLWTIEAGQSLPMRSHRGSECIMVIMGGMGEYVDDGGRRSVVDDGMMMVVPPDTKYGFNNTGNGPLVVLSIRGPGPFD